MKPFQKILVASDFSEHARNAVDYAADIARRYEATLLIVHVYQPVNYALPDGYMLYTPEQMTTMMGEFQKQLENAKEKALAAGAPRVETSLPIGGAAFEIVEAAKSSGCDLIVMGTHGRTGIRHMLLGSTAERVVRTSDCPVLTVKRETA